MTASKIIDWCISLTILLIVTCTGCESREDSQANIPQSETEAKNNTKKTVESQMKNLFRAINSGDVVAVASICRGNIDLNIKHQGLTPLERAAGKKRPDGNGYDDIVSILIDSGARVNETDERGWTALHVASTNGNINVVKLLIEEGAGVNIKDRMGKTPMKWAIIMKRTSVIEFLRTHGGVE